MPAQLASTPKVSPSFREARSDLEAAATPICDISLMKLRGIYLMIY